MTNRNDPTDFAHEELEVRVRERTAELSRANEALRAEVAERARAEEALMESEQRYRDLFENANDVIYTLDLRGNCASLNKAGEQVTGYSREEVVGTNFSRLLAPGHPEAAVRQLHSAAADGPGAPLALELLARDGRRIALEVSTRLIYRQGKPIGVQGIARDVSERRRLEEQLLRWQKMEAVSRLAGGVAHDFNNLLTVIMGYSELLLSGIPENDPLCPQIQEIARAASRAATLTSQLRAFGRKAHLTPLVLDLNRLLDDTGHLLGRTLGEDVAIRTELAPDLGQVRADPGQLQQVILNLALNARDAMPQGGKLTFTTVNVVLDERAARTYVDVAPGPYVALAVHDTGCGMTEDVRAHLFEPFFTTKDMGRGTGLGLSTTYGIVKQSGGHIEVASQPGRGSTFTVLLPRVLDSSPAETMAGEAAGLAGGSETILLVEDQEEVRSSEVRALRQRGYTVLEAGNGIKAAHIGERQPGPIHLLVTDVVMPQISGPELAERLAPLRPDMRVLFRSCYTGPAGWRGGGVRARSAFLPKPATPDALARKVREVLDR